MKNKILKGICCILVAITALADVRPLQVMAANDSKAADAGFEVDRDLFKSVKWWEEVVTNVYYNKTLVGYTITDIGNTVSLQDSNLKIILLRTTVKGKGKERIYGYADNLKMSAQLKSGQKLWAHDPKQEKTSETYEIGLTASSSKEVGISATHEFEKNSLDINDMSDRAEGYVGVEYDYDHWDVFRFDWKNNKYAYNENDQIMAYTIKTSQSKFNHQIVVYPRFALYDSPPDWWADRVFGNKKVGTQMTIYIKTQY